jgi:recombination protein RecR
MNFGKMMKDLQKMQAKLQDEIDVLEIEATAGGGMVTVRMNGKKEVLALQVEPEAITPEDPEMLQDLIVAAINECSASRRAWPAASRSPGCSSPDHSWPWPPPTGKESRVSSLAPPIERVIEQLAKLPGVGRKTAQRLAFHLLKAPPEDASALAKAIVDLKERIRFCSTCFNLSEGELCPVCADPRRDPTVLCVVEEPTNVAGIERTGVFRGLYHVLGGALSPLKDLGPDDLRIRELVERIRGGQVQEVVLATDPNVEGEATAVYLSRLLHP